MAICGNIEYEREMPPQFLTKKAIEEKTVTNRYAQSSEDENAENVFIVDEELKRRGEEELKYEMRDSVSDPRALP